MKEMKAYQCSFCRFYKKTKVSVLNHEKHCFYNPENRACATCQHNILDFLLSEDDNVLTKVNVCQKKNIDLDAHTLCLKCPLWEAKNDYEV